ncbi:MAG: regulatory iron-sulfur-containing complex subunit RicT [Planctomycetota bacterium]
MPILPLPQFEADLAEYEAEQDRLARERLTPPKTVVCRFGCMQLIGEFRYDLDVTPGCGSRLVVRTFRGTEIGEMLTSTCPNAGCGKSVTRKQMLEYIDASGGRQYPFFDRGRVLRVPLPDDMERQEEIEQSRHELKLAARRIAEAEGLGIRIVQAEPILGGETITFYFLSEGDGGGRGGQRGGPRGMPPGEGSRGGPSRADISQMVDALQREHRARVELRPVGARDEARLTADYERCGQHCCCKNFLKVLKPVPMRTAKQQKATLDPLKISGRCGRLMCCLRYEDESYRELAARLPHRRTRVGTPEGAGEVLDTQILTQLVLVRLEGSQRDVAVPVEELCDPDEAAAKHAEPPAAPRPERPRADDGAPATKKKRRKKKPRPPGGNDGEGPAPQHPSPQQSGAAGEDGQPRPKKKRRRKKRRRSGGDGPGSPPNDPSSTPPSTPRGGPPA